MNLSTVACAGRAVPRYFKDRFHWLYQCHVTRVLGVNSQPESIMYTIVNLLATDT